MNSIIQTVGDSPFTDIIPLYDFIMRIEELDINEKLLLCYLIGQWEEDNEYYDLEPEEFYEDCRWGRFIAPKYLKTITNRLYDKGYLTDKSISDSHRYYRINVSKVLEMHENDLENCYKYNE